MNELYEKGNRNAMKQILAFISYVILSSIIFLHPQFSISEQNDNQPMLYSKVSIPKTMLSKESYMGDLRIGDLNGDDMVEFVIFRSKANGIKPCFIGAVSHNGEIMWTKGQGGKQPIRPGSLTVYDFNGDGKDEILTFFLNSKIDAPSNSMANVVVQIRDGMTGEVLKENAPEALTLSQGEGPNWVHQRLLIANLRGTEQAKDFVVKLGSRLLAFDDDLNVLWTYSIKWNEYSRCSAYIPSVGDIDRDGKDEINGGYYLLDEDGTPKWEKPLGRHMDSVAIVPWKNDQMAAICSGFGHVMDGKGNILLKLGKENVPHGQEVRVADFLPNSPGQEMIIRNQGHSPNVIVVSNHGEIIYRFRLNDSPNHTGMEAIYWFGKDQKALLYNGGMLWEGNGKVFAKLPNLPRPIGDPKMGWYHCIPANICGDEREEVVIYNPWDKYIWIYTPSPFNEKKFNGYEASPRQYNVRLMD